MKKIVHVSSVALVALFGCAQPRVIRPSIPSLEYTQQFKSPKVVQTASAGAIGAATAPKAQLRLVDGEGVATDAPAPGFDTVSNEVNPELPGVDVYRGRMDLTRDYQGPLELGDPGVTASLWKESRGANDMLRDDRAWESGDLITILVTESDQGSRQAKTDSKSKTTLGASLAHFLGIAELFDESRKTYDGENLIEGSSKFEFKGEGKTDRKNSLTAKISAMVAEVLPTGILRIEGKKIVAVNDEEQIMVISGLVRTRDVNSSNEIDSSKIANMRIDYFGKGTVDEASSPGWGTRVLQSVWPF